MALIFITGNSGVGKSAVREELQRRGYEAHDTDENDLSAWQNMATGKFVSFPENPNERDNKWHDVHKWRMSRQKVEELAQHAKNKLVFLCGSPNNADDMLDLYDQVICLTLDKASLQHRLTNRTSNDYGKGPDELNSILGWHDSFQERYRSSGAIMVDASKPVTEVVNDILRQVKES